MTLNAMMAHKRAAHLEVAEGNKANGYRPGRPYGHGKLLEAENGQAGERPVRPGALAKPDRYNL